MAIANLQEKLLFYTQQKSRISTGLSNVQMQQLSATKTSATKQQEYNAKLQDLYYDDEHGYGTEEYSECLLELQNDHEFEMASINSWESELETQKDNLETQLNENLILKIKIKEQILNKCLLFYLYFILKS